MYYHTWLVCLIELIQSIWQKKVELRENLNVYICTITVKYVAKVFHHIINTVHEFKHIYFLGINSFFFFFFVEKSYL